MGCSTSMQTKRPSSKQQDFSLSICDAHKTIIKSTWSKINENRVTVGKKTFLRLLEAKPELQDKFPGKLDIEKLKTTRILFGHNKILMTSIENAVTSVDDNESFKSYLVELGRRHQVRPLKAEHLEAMHLAFMATLKELFQENWTTQAFDAWSSLVTFMFEAMKIGLRDT